MNSLVNGRPAGQISVSDRGLAYGDGVFRTIRCEAGRLLLWPRHYAKLAADCAALGITCPAEALLLADIAHLDAVDGVIKIIVSRGESQRGYACVTGAPVTRIVQLSALPAYSESLYSDGAVVRLCDWPLSIQPGLAGIKHLNRLDQVMARREWTDTAIFDGLMCNGRGELVEGVISNLFLLQDGCLHTHPLHDCGVAGVARQLLLELAPGQGLNVQRRALHLDDLQSADAVLLSNSLAGIVPVSRLGDMHWPLTPQLTALRLQWLQASRREWLAAKPV
ncbi:aminodeoxychorismate lyase [Chitinimonas sp.]|uniref:aminodeoxychorismate lyase n=1 Tax=Chitinimonas sp. TaxID=1934313 RepID=UPI0035AFADB4